MISKLAQLVPEFIELKQITLQGKAQKLIKNVGKAYTSHQITSLIKERV
jgi:hypothetical protein